MTIIFLAFFLIATVLWLCYWALVRPVILDGVEIEQEGLRSAVEWSIIEGLPESQSKPAQHLAYSLENTNPTRLMSLGAILFVVARHRTTIKVVAAKEKEIFANCPSWIRDIQQRNAQLSIKATLANSPLWWIPLASLLLAAVFSKRIADWLTDAQTAATKLQSENLPVPV